MENTILISSPIDYYLSVAYNLIMEKIKCIVDGCSNFAKYKSGLCSKHYERLRLWGKLEGRAKEERGNYKHGMRHTPEYESWCNLRRRCLDTGCTMYKHYGGRGIKVCNRWLGEHGFENFIADMGRRPSKEYSIDRIDVNGDYSPENCRWATSEQQMANQRKSIRVVVDGKKKMCLAQAVRYTGICRQTAYERYWAGKEISPRIRLEVNHVCKS